MLPLGCCFLQVRPSLLHRRRRRQRVAEYWFRILPVGFPGNDLLSLSSDPAPRGNGTSIFSEEQTTCSA